VKSLVPVGIGELAARIRRQSHRHPSPHLSQAALSEALSERLANELGPEVS
jgi:hypothetical protein